MNPNHLHRMLLAPEDNGAGGGASDVPAAPSPAPTPSPTPAAPAPRVPFVMPPDDGAPAPAPSPAPGGPAPGGPSAAGPQDNPIPYSRVREMLQQQERRLRQEFGSRPTGPTPEQRLEIAKQALRMAGIEVPDEAPRQLSAPEIEQMVQQRFSQIEQRLAVQSLVEQGNRELAAAKAEHADAFTHFPMLESIVTQMWGSDTSGKTMGQIVKEVVAGLESHYTARSQAYAQRKLGDRGVAPIRPTAALGAGARPPQHDLATQAGQDAALDEILGAEG